MLVTGAPQYQEKTRTAANIFDPGSGYLCQQEPVAHFGLGSATPDQVVVTWPGGQRRTLTNLAEELRVAPLWGRRCPRVQSVGTTRRDATDIPRAPISHPLFRTLASIRTAAV